MKWYMWMCRPENKNSVQSALCLQLICAANEFVRLQGIVKIYICGELWHVIHGNSTYVYTILCAIKINSLTSLWYICSCVCAVMHVYFICCIHKYFVSSSQCAEQRRVFVRKWTRTNATTRRWTMGQMVWLRLGIGLTCRWQISIFDRCARGTTAATTYAPCAWCLGIVMGRIWTERHATRAGPDARHTQVWMLYMCVCVSCIELSEAMCVGAIWLLILTTTHEHMMQTRVQAGESVTTGRIFRWFACATRPIEEIYKTKCIAALKSACTANEASLQRQFASDHAIRAMSDVDRQCDDVVALLCTIM